MDLPGLEPSWKFGRYARVTLLAEMQEVQTLSLVGVPPMTVRTVWMFGDHLRLVRLCEWLMDLPNTGDLPHTSQTLDKGNSLKFVGRYQH
jgi:hypothetical protein